MIPHIKELENSFERLFGVYLRASDCRSVEECRPPFLVPMTVGHTSGHSWRLYSLLDLNQDSHSHSQQLFCDHHGYHQDHLWSLSINRPYITQKSWVSKVPPDPTPVAPQGWPWPVVCQLLFGNSLSHLWLQCWSPLNIWQYSPRPPHHDHWWPGFDNCRETPSQPIWPGFILTWQNHEAGQFFVVLGRRPAH